MRLFTVFVLIIAATSGCRDAVDPSGPTFSGFFVKIDSTLPGVERLGVRSTDLSPSQLPLGEYNYAVTLRGKLLKQTTSGYEEIAVSQLPLNSPVLVWTTSTDRRMVRQPLEATKIVVPLL